MFFVYILQSLKNHSYYTGQTKNIEKRLERHNKGEFISTRRGAPYKVVHKEHYLTRGEAMRREKQIKSYKGGNAFKKLLGLT